MLVDAKGNPLSPARAEALREQQTANVGHLHTEWESHPSRGLTPPKLASILQLAEQGDLVSQHELFADMEEKDGHLFAEMQKRRLAIKTLVQSGGWDVKPPENASAAEKQQAEAAKGYLEALPDLADLVFDMTDAIGHGFSALELKWADEGRDKVICCADFRPQTWFQQYRLDRNQIRLRDHQSADGAELWPYGWVVHRHAARSAYTARMGLFRVLAWPFLFKNYTVRDLQEFIEIYGLPLRLGTYPQSAGKDEKLALLRAVVNIGHDAAAIIPAGMAIDFKEAAKGDNKPFEFMVELMERTMSKAILGGTLTSGEGSHGTQALGNVHNEVRKELRDADAHQIGNTITRQIIWPLLQVNMGLHDVRRCPRFALDTQEPEDLKLFADALPKLVGMGMGIPTRWAHDKLRIPEPAAGEAVLVAPPASAPAAPAPTGSPPPAPPADPAAAANAAARAALAAAGAAGQPTPVDDLAAAALTDEAAAEVVAWVAPALAAATSFEEFEALLAAQVGEAPPPGMTSQLARAQFAARIWGRLDRRTLADRKAGDA